MEIIHEQKAENNFSSFSQEMQKLFDYVLWDLKTKQHNFKLAHQITLESIDKINNYLQTHEDPLSANLLSKFYYQAGCDLNKSDDPKSALEFFEKSLSAQQLCYETSGEFTHLHELASCHFLLGRQLQRIGLRDQSVFQYNTSHQILKDLCSFGYGDSVQEDLEAVLQQLSELR